MVKAVCYLCTTNRDIVETSLEHEILRNPEPVAAEPIFQNGEWKLNFADKTRVWKVGETIRDRLTAEVAVSVSHWHQKKNGSYQWLFGRDSKREHFEPDDFEELQETDLTIDNRPRLTPEKIAAIEQRQFDERPGAPKSK